VTRNAVPAPVSHAKSVPEFMGDNSFSNAIASTEVVDIFAAAGLKKPDISILSDEFLAEVHKMPQRGNN
jgi:Domain of unknown function (DUF3387)